MAPYKQKAKQPGGRVPWPAAPAAHKRLPTAPIRLALPGSLQPAASHLRHFNRGGDWGSAQQGVHLGCCEGKPILLALGVVQHMVPAEEKRGGAGGQGRLQ